MRHCPKCGSSIDYLKNYQPAEIVYEFRLEDDPDYIKDDIIIDELNSGDYECPWCKAVIAREEGDAVAFLQGKAIRQEMAEYYTELAMEGDNV